MNYDTNVIYGDREHSAEFTLDNYTFYLTKTGNPKKLNRDTNERMSITQEEYREARKRYDYLFN